MGKAIGGVIGAHGGVLNQALKPFGLGGGQGEYFQGQTANPELEQYSSLINGEAYDPVKGTQMATAGVQNNPLFSSLFGNKGLQSRLDTEEQDLATNGFQLNNMDRTAYGQASGDIARMFGESENQLASSLASRGLASAPSGIAGAQFSGLMGNKNEQLAKAQMQIAQNRVQSNMERLNQTRNMMSQLGQQAGQALNDQFGRQTAKGDALAQGAQLRQNQIDSTNAAQQASLEDKRGAKGLTLMDAAGRGLFSGTEKGVSSRTASAIGGPGAAGGGGGAAGGGMGGSGRVGGT